MTVKFNLGCGIKKENGWVNADRKEQDLNDFPWKWADNSVDEIRMDMVLEHLLFIERVMEECWRMLKPNGKLTIIVPWYRSIDAFSDVEHFHFFNDRSMYTFEHPESNPQTYAHFKVVNAIHTKNPSPYFKLIPIHFRNFVFNLCTTIEYQMVKI